MAIAPASPMTYEEEQRVLWMHLFCQEVLDGPGGMGEDELEEHVKSLMGWSERRKLVTLKAWHWQEVAKEQRRINRPDEVVWDTRGAVAWLSGKNGER